MGNLSTGNSKGLLATGMQVFVGLCALIHQPGARTMNSSVGNAELSRLCWKWILMGLMHTIHTALTKIHIHMYHGLTRDWHDQCIVWEAENSCG